MERVVSCPKRLQPNDVEVAIVGAGISGLALALRLQQLGVKSVRVLERDASVDCRPQGYSLTLQEPGRDALKSLGLLDSVRSHSVTGGGGQYLLDAHDGRVIQSLGTNVGKTEGSQGSRNLFVPRQQLRRLLLDALAPGTISWGSQITAYSEDETSVELKMQNASTLRCSVLVGCDGVGSVIRKSKLDDSLRYLGVGVINGITASAGPRLSASGSMQVMDGRARMFLKPFADGRAMWQLSFPMTEEQALNLRQLPKEELRAQAEDETRCWNQEFRQVLEDTPLEALRGSGFFDREPAHCGEHPASSLIAVIGDAAHPMSPFKGQGANQALRDAVELASRLADCQARPDPTGHGALDRFLVAQTLTEFHSAMASRVSPLVLGSRRNVAFFHTPEALDSKSIGRFRSQGKAMPAC
eukprot:gb/GFBE01016584.1/.p1 GENE.gb/GFBE01016584.1/~~gb/GFBE01016584.1/.p1  ORF type:complete len:413 (+),score=73.29 gb/GFBE01016584.1/:1-1239(+)